MSTDNPDTIVALATPPGRGGVAIIRLSGSSSYDIGSEISNCEAVDRFAHHTSFLDTDQSVIDEGIALFFKAPRSFTGEDVFELQCHGGPVVVDMLLRRCLGRGARLAQPGEFSERAFLNNKLDLAQAEAISDLIASTSEQAARSAVRSLQGAFSTEVDGLLEALIRFRVYIEAALDFPEEEIDFLADKHVADSLDAILDKLQCIRSKAKQGSLLRDGMHLVIAGRPNAGKSSLLNALAGSDAAIVTDVAGTTRDVLREKINLAGMPLHVVDTAGLRSSDDPVEQMGIQRAWAEIDKADLILLLVDSEQGYGESDEDLISQLPTHIPVLRVFNKIDKSKQNSGKCGEDLYISAKHEIGLDDLKHELVQRMGYRPQTEDVYIARRRHLDALEKTDLYIQDAKVQLLEYNAGELVAEELRLAQEVLGSITGKFSADDLLGEIFSSFCIGK